MSPPRLGLLGVGLCPPPTPTPVSDTFLIIQSNLLYLSLDSSVVSAQSLPQDPSPLSAA